MIVKQAAKRYTIILTTYVPDNGPLLLLCCLVWKVLANIVEYEYCRLRPLYSLLLKSVYGIYILHKSAMAFNWFSVATP